MIKGIHHVALKCDGLESFEKTLDFYENVIGMKVLRRWGEGAESGAMLEIGGDVIEFFADGQVSDHTGSINHFAFLTDDPDACIEKIREAGYPVTREPDSLDLMVKEPTEYAYPLRVAFCIGPAGEEIEFFCER